MTQNYIYRDSLSQRAGAFLKREMKRRGYTQFEFAEVIGVDERTIRRWVAGDINKLTSIDDICCALHCNVTDIFSDSDEDVPLIIKNPCIGHILSCTGMFFCGRILLL